MAQYVIYLRKSRSDLEAEAHGEGETLLRHEKTLLELSEKLHLEVKGIYREIVSGETIAARPMMQQLLSEVEKQVWDGVLVMEIERLARGDTIDQGIVAQTFKYGNAKIITPLKIYDPADEFDEEYFEFGLFMSRREYKTINRRIQRGRMASLREGKFISSTAPYGYNRVRVDCGKGYTLQINPEQSEVVKMIFMWYTHGLPQPDGSFLRPGVSKIAEKLNALGLQAKHAGTWSRSSVSDILKNPVYIGKLRWAYRKERTSVQNNGIVKTRPKSKDLILTDGLHEAIITPEIFYQAQEIFSKRERLSIPGNRILKNPLAGIVYCGKCGTLMTRHAGTKKTPYDTIKCPNRLCDNISAPLSLVESVTIEALAKWLKDYTPDRNLILTYPPLQLSEAEKEVVIRGLNNQLQKLKLQKERLCSLLEQGVYETELYEERSRKISRETARLEQILQEQEAELRVLKETACKNTAVLPDGINLVDLYRETESAAVRNEALKMLLQKVIYIKSEPNEKGNKDNANFELTVYPRTVKFRS